MVVVSGLIKLLDPILGGENTDWLVQKMRVVWLQLSLLTRVTVQYYCTVQYVLCNKCEANTWSNYRRRSVAHTDGSHTAYRLLHRRAHILD